MCAHAHKYVFHKTPSSFRCTVAPEARSHTQAQGSYASTEGYDRRDTKHWCVDMHASGGKQVWTVESCVRLRDKHLQRGRRELVVIDADGGGLKLHLVVLEHTSDFGNGAASFRGSLWPRALMFGAWRRHLREGKEE